MSQAPTMLSPGDVVSGKYRILEEVGRGSYGVVFRATQLGIERDVALKTLLPAAVGTDEGQRFEREARLVSRLTHPHIITLFDYGEHEGVLYMVMEYVEGRSLGDLIKQEAPLPASTVRGLIYQMLDALQYAHDQGVVHRDLKPENIWLIRSPSMQTESREMVKILDFGIAKVLRGQKEVSALDTLTQTGFALGTPQYMSPENITGDSITHQADLYAVGLIMYEMLTGHPPFDSTSPHTAMVSHLRDEPPPLPKELGLGAWQRAIDLCLQKQPDDRIGSAREIREVLEVDEKIVGPGSKKMSTMGKPSRKPLAWALGGLVLTVLLSVIVIWQVLGSRPEVMLVEGPPVAGATQGERGVLEDLSGEPTTRGSEGMGSAGMGSAGMGSEGMGRPVAEVVLDEDDIVVEGAKDGGGGAPASEQALEAEVDPEQLAAQAERAALRRAARAEAAEASAKSADKVSLRFESEPDKARVSLDGRPIGLTPLVREVPMTDSSIRVGFSLIGYREKHVMVVPDKDQSVEVRMERGRLQLTP